MNQRIIYPNDQGGVAVIVPAPDCGLTIEQIALKDVPAGGELLVDYRASMRVNFGLYLEGETLCQDG